MISIKLLCNFIEIAPWHGCLLHNLLHIFRTPLYKNTYGELLLKTWKTLQNKRCKTSCDNVRFFNKVAGGTPGLFRKSVQQITYGWLFLCRDHSFSKYPKFSKDITFLTPFRRVRNVIYLKDIFHTYKMNGTSAVYVYLGIFRNVHDNYFLAPLSRVASTDAMLITQV